MSKYLYILACVLLTAACGAGDKAEADISGKTAEEGTLILGTVNTLASLPLWVAEEEGVFDSLGVDIKVKDYRDQLECDMAFVKGKSKLVLTDSVRVAWMKAAHKTAAKHLKTVDMPLTFISNAKARVTELKQLKEKLVAVTRHSISTEYANHCIDSVKLNRDDVYVVQINDPNVALLMMLNNELDAAFMPEPQAALALKAGHRTLFKRTAKAFLVEAPGTLGTDQEKALLQAWDEAAARIRKNGQEHYKDLIARRCKLQ